ncbi:MAG TPA: NAD(P)-binding domain-containing protein [Nannocystaceae bacterium]|nr:NAD(P)-binding domain-containing protein [Nannocystaceae bacterium]
MKYGVLGTGMVGQVIASKLVALGHEVMMGSRARGHEKAVAWAQGAGPRASEGSFADAAAFGARIFNCTAGVHSLAALAAAGDENLEGKILVDLANPLDFSRGFPPTLSVGNDDSLGEQIQRAHPRLKVVKALNTINCLLMVDPSRVPGNHTIFVAGDDAAAKEDVLAVLGEFGWAPGQVIDGGGSPSRAGPRRTSTSGCGSTGPCRRRTSTSRSRWRRGGRRASQGRRGPTLGRPGPIYMS